MPTIRSSRVVVGGEVRPATVRHESGTIVDVGWGHADVDYGDLVVMPGLVDSHVHVNEPGRTEWEGFETATRAAVSGGTTTIIDMPLNSIPPTIDMAALSSKRSSANKSLWCDVAFWGGLVPGNQDDIPGLIAQGVCGFKAFLVDSGVPEFPPVRTDRLKDDRGGLPTLVHAESSGHIKEFAGDPRSYAAYLRTRPVAAEVAAIEAISHLAGPMHVLHVSSGEAAELIGRTHLTGETCPHYLTFASEDIPDGATAYKCAPPIRDSSAREALWQALIKNDLDMVVSDHSPAPPELKELESGDFSAAWGGISSLQLRLPAVWTGAESLPVGFAQLTEWLSTSPARLSGLDSHKGSIEPGLDADLVVWDPEAEYLVAGAGLQHRHPVTPYEGMRLKGRVVETILAGKAVFSKGIVGHRRGRMLRRQ